MYTHLQALLSDQKGGPVFTCFGLYHWIYIFLIVGGILLTVLLLKNKSQKAQQKAVLLSVHIAFGLYIADFFMMPFAYGEIDLEKLPFHACTAMCVMCFLSRHNAFFKRFKWSFALLGLASNLIYMLYPAGVGWYQIYPLSYRVIQTLLFHGIMTAHGVLVLAFDGEKPTWKHLRRDLAVITGMTVWAWLGNFLYNGTHGDYRHHFNWFFVTADPFGMLPGEIAPYIMPFVMIIVMSVAELLIYAAYLGLRKLPSRRSSDT